MRLTTYNIQCIDSIRGVTLSSSSLGYQKPCPLWWPAFFSCSLSSVVWAVSWLPLSRSWDLNLLQMICLGELRSTALFPYTFLSFFPGGIFGILYNLHRSFLAPTSLCFLPADPSWKATTTNSVPTVASRRRRWAPARVWSGRQIGRWRFQFAREWFSPGRVDLWANLHAWDHKLPRLGPFLIASWVFPSESAFQS